VRFSTPDLFQAGRRVVDIPFAFQKTPLARFPQSDWETRTNQEERYPQKTRRDLHSGRDRDCRWSLTILGGSDVNYVQGIGVRVQGGHNLNILALELFRFVLVVELVRRLRGRFL